MSLGGRIRAERKARDLSQEEMARKLGVSHEAISQWETGAIEYLRPENLVRTARLFGVTVEWLVFGTEPKRPKPCNPHVPPPNQAALDSDALDLITLYQQISPECRPFVHRFIRFISLGCA
jgi:transcriptional regulator with XRE-family HTH domain